MTLQPFFWCLIGWVAFKKLVYSIFGMRPHVNFHFFDGLCPKVQIIKKVGGTWKALDILYNLEYKEKPGFLSRIEDFWTNILNIKAVRNRSRLVQFELKKIIINFLSRGEEVRILELAAGSAQPLLEVLAYFRERGILNIKVLLLDNDPSALDYAKILAVKYGVQDQVEVVKTNAFFVKRVARVFRPNIIEMVGLLDYLPDNAAKKLLTNIKEALLPSCGVFVTANIVSNCERVATHLLYAWPKMFYRSPHQLETILQQAGFDKNRITAEPLNIHCLAVAYN